MEGASTAVIGTRVATYCHPRACPEDPSSRMLPTPNVCDAMRSYWTYILASKPRGTLFIGVTKGLMRRIADMCQMATCESPED